MSAEDPIDEAVVSFERELERRGLSLIDELGRGGMGVVFKARDARRDRLVAVKLLTPKALDDRNRKRFKREGRALAVLEHPHIVKVHDSGEAAGIPFLIMDFVAGEPLVKLARNFLDRPNKPPSPGLMRIMTQVAGALAHCHAHDLVHRDLNPQNIIVETASKRPIVVDFGLVKRLSSPDELGVSGFSERLTAFGDIVGTPAFMAPEQIDASGGFGELGPKSDVWSLSASLFFCLTGEAPYPTRENPIEFLFMRVSQEPRRARALNAAVPEWLDELCRSGLSLQVAERPSMAELAAAFLTGFDAMLDDGA